jgi:hypothetical protein
MTRHWQNQPRTHKMPREWVRINNLSRRHPKPALGNGRLQVAVRRAFIAADAAEISSTEIYNWALISRRRRRSHRNRWRVWQILMATAERCGRAQTIGRPWLWRLKAEIKVLKDVLKSLRYFQR